MYPCGATRPTASNLNYQAGQTIANTIIAKVGTKGRVCIYTHAATHLIVDINGYHSVDSSYQALPPARLLESRADATSTIDGQFWPIGQRHAKSVTQLTVNGRGGVASNATAVVLNIAVTDPQAAGYITVYPCGATRPTASNLNYQAGQTIANTIIAKVGTKGRVCIYTHAATHFIVDINGYHTTAA